LGQKAHGVGSLGSLISLPILPKFEAAAELGISVSTLKALSKGGFGKVQSGRPGRGNCSLYDTGLLEVRVRRTELSAPALAQLHRGALAATLMPSLRLDLKALAMSGELRRYEVPAHMHGKLIELFETWLTNRVESHFDLGDKWSEK